MPRAPLRTAFRPALLSGAAAVGVALVAVGASSCQDPTQLTLVVTAEPQCAITSTAVYVGSSADEASAKAQTGSPEALTGHCSGGDIGTLVVTPGQMSGAVVIIGAVGKSATNCVEGHYDGCIIARRSFAFVKHTPLRIPIELDVDCENVPCDATTTCVHGHCKQASVDCSADGTCSDPSASGDVTVDGGPQFFPDGAPMSMDSGMTSTDGSTGDGGGDASTVTDSGVDGSDSGTVSGSTDSGADAGNPGFDAGNQNAMCLFDGTHLYLSACGAGGATCNYPQGCCATVAMGPLSCNAGDSCAAGTPVGCCDDADCPTGQTCCGPPTFTFAPTPFLLPEAGAKVCAGGPLTAGGSPGHCQ